MDWKKTAKKAAVILFWLAVWQLAAALADNSVLLAGPAEAAQALIQNAAGADFWKAAVCSTGRICLGFLAAFALGILSGSAACFHPGLQELLAPFVSAAKAVPVAVFTVILLIWSGTTGLTVWVSFLIAFPQVYSSTITGLQSTDQKLLEMAAILKTEPFKKFFFIYRPALMPYLAGCCKSALGMSFKSGIAAEVIGTPEYSIGERLYMAKIQLDTAGIFAWAFVIVVLSFVFEKIFLYLLQRYAERKQPFPAPEKRRNRPADRTLREIVLRHVTYAYGDKTILQDYGLTLRPGGRYCLLGESGCGKTTLLRLLAGLAAPRKGTVGGTDCCSMVFQEDRLCEEADAVRNVCMARGVDTETAVSHLSQLLELQDCRRPVSELSGGMKRRVALCRAAAAGGSLLLLDEPFNGLDEQNREKAVRYLLQEQRGRTLVIATHREEDAFRLGAETIRLK